MTKKAVRIGVVGAGRGAAYLRAARLDMGLELVAVCDASERRLANLDLPEGVLRLTDEAEFLAQDMDAVVIATYFDAHAPLAIRALRAGFHVLSEITANATMAEGVALCEAVEETGRIYMMGENSAYTDFNQAMTELYASREIGRVLYAEAEYNHPMPPETMLRLAPARGHWRNWLPSTYYCTHALGPLMAITDTWPVAVNALSIPAPELGPQEVRINDPGSVILCRMDNDAVFRLFGIRIPGHSNWYRLHGTGGAMENVRGPGYFGPGQVRVWHDPWNCPPGQPTERSFVPEWPDHGATAAGFGHSGADFWVVHHFVEAVRSGRPPFLDVYRSVAMSSVGLLAWRSALADGQSVAVPDFRDPGARGQFRDDHLRAGPDTPDAERLPSSIRGEVEIDRADLERAERFWNSLHR